jgi:hypothetical protein
LAVKDGARSRANVLVLGGYIMPPPTYNQVLRANETTGTGKHQQICRVQP